MLRPYKEPTDRKTEARTQSGLNSLLWIFVGALITVMIGVFFYLSPLFDSFRNEVDVNPPVEVTPLPQDPSKPAEYEFYDILPEREFKGSSSGLGQSPEPTPAKPEPTTADKPAPAPAEEKPVDVIVSAPKSGEITVVEEEATYDEPATKEEVDAAIDGNISIKSSKTYILQVRSYDNAEEADRKREEVVLAGVDARVVRRTDASGGELYQVISSPMPSRAAAIQAEQLLGDSGIDAIIIEQRH